MKLKEIMNRTVETIHPSESLQSAAHRMDSQKTGILAVVEAEMPIGVVTERDIVTRGVALGLDPKITRVREVMTMNIDSLSEEDEVEEAIRLMEEKQLRGLVVRGVEQPLAGVVTLDALALEAAGPEFSGASASRSPNPLPNRPR